MTREEAITYWKHRSEHIHEWLTENECKEIAEYGEAIDMAISALEEEYVQVEADTLPPKVPLEWMTQGIILLPRKDYEKLRKGLEEWQSVADMPQTEPSDLISRHEALMELNGACSNWQDDAKVAEIIQALPSVSVESKATENKYDCDLISRADLIAQLEEWKKNPNNDDSSVDMVNHFIGIIKAQPSAEQVTSKLKNPCDSLLTEDSEDSKEQKSKLDLISRAELIKHFKTFNEKYLTLDTICDEVQSAPSVSVPQGDLVSRTEAVEEIERAKEAKGTNAFKAGLVCAKGIVQSVPSVSAERVGEWIPCSEKLPEYDKEVLVTLWGDVIDVGHFSYEERGVGLTFSTNDFELRGKDVFEEVNAWQPLPKPYEAKMKGGAE